MKQADLSDNSAARLMYVASSAWLWLWEVMFGRLHVIGGVKVVNPIEIGIVLVGFFL